MSLNEFTYTIDEFDVGNKTLKVSFDDGSWALINLKSPLPSSEQEVDDIVKHYTATKEVMEARSISTDLSFIDNLVGCSRTAERFSTTTKEIPQSSPLNPGEVIL